MSSQVIQKPIKSGEMILPYYEGHYYVAYDVSSLNEGVINKVKKETFL